HPPGQQHEVCGSFYGVTVSTPDSKSGYLGSNPALQTLNPAIWVQFPNIRLVDSKMCVVRLYVVTVSTPNSESGDLGSNPDRTLYILDIRLVNSTKYVVRFYGVTDSTPDSESGDLGLNP
ncbi:hypothetical protein FOL47_003571, partial [Perkinsus chesapeaki]